MRRMRTAALIAMAALLVAGASMAMSCDGRDGEALTLEAYFQRLVELDGEWEELLTERPLDELDEEFEGLLAAGDAAGALNLLADSIEDMLLPPLKRFVEGLEALDPPSEVEEAHSRAIDDGRWTLRAFEDLVMAIRSGQALEDGGDFGSISVFLSVSDSFDQSAPGPGPSCLDLERIADQHGIAVTLFCSGSALD